jgi:8-oxo-dGTP diphosphatase
MDRRARSTYGYTRTVHTVLVAAAIVIERGRVLLSQRKPGTHLEGKWEFPGGKVQPGEDPRDSVRRELEEELGIEVTVGDVVDVTFHRYDDVEKAVLLLFFEAFRAPGSLEPRAIDVAAFAWAGVEELDPTRFPPADVAVLRKVRARLR